MSDNIYTALLKVQATPMVAKKKETAKAGSFNYKYADLDEVWQSCREALTKNGIVVVQAQQGNALETQLVHPESDTKIVSITPLINQKGDMQGLGSAITYARRYAVVTMAGVVTDDDDGQAASTPAPQRPVAVSANSVPPEKVQKARDLMNKLGKTGKEGLEFTEMSIGKRIPVTEKDFDGLIESLEAFDTMVGGE